MQLIRVLFTLFSAFVCLSCAENQQIASNGSEGCFSSEIESKTGQIRYFDGFSLFIENCGVIGSIDLEFKNTDVSSLILAQVVIDGPPVFQYVDIEYSGKLQEDGRVLILDISKANIAKKSKFPPSDGKLCKQLNLPVENCADL